MSGRLRERTKKKAPKVPQCDKETKKVHDYWTTGVLVSSPPVYDHQMSQNRFCQLFSFSVRLGRSKDTRHLQGARGGRGDNCVPRPAIVRRVRGSRGQSPQPASRLEPTCRDSGPVAHPTQSSPTGGLHKGLRKHWKALDKNMKIGKSLRFKKGPQTNIYIYICIYIYINTHTYIYIYTYI